MTENFARKIGEGGYGTVFQGHVGETAVAVKRLNKQLSTDVEKEFLQEVESIGMIHHVHLVSLLGYCAEGSHQLLVYEFVEKGTLDRALFRGDNLQLPVLDWRTRFAVAIQTARGLAYLHDDCEQKIIHCDIKPENILLDSSQCAKVADFGLLRIMKGDQTRTLTMNIRGTYGHIAPEYMCPAADGMAITTKVDVCSYGMVLLEIISGRRNLIKSKFDAPDWYFPRWAFAKIETDVVVDVLDKSLTGIVDVEELRRAVQVAFWCINDRPHLRP